MAKTDLLKNVNKALLAGLVITILSFIFTLTPCKKDTGLGVCKLPSPFSNLSNTSDKYYGFTNNPLTGLMAQFLLPAILVFVILYNMKKRSYKVVDYTKK